MKLMDSIYGEYTVEPIFEKLINTPEVQRLKHIHQGGASYLVNPKWNVTRYEHSIGTMLLIRRIGGTIEEQIAGLLHDISHTAFSHVVDFAFKNQNEDYHEEIYEKILKSSSIITILTEAGYNAEAILFNESKYTLLDKPSPKLCADRIDYTLRDMYHYFNTPKHEIEQFLAVLTVVNHEIVITSLQMSEWFIALYYKEVVNFFMHPLNIYAYHQLAKAINQAFELNEIVAHDLLKTDVQLFDVLKHSKHSVVRELINGIHPNINVIENNVSFDIYQKNKLRLIDPTVYHHDKLIATSTLSPKAKQLSETAFNQMEEGIYIKILSN